MLYVFNIEDFFLNVLAIPFALGVSDPAFPLLPPPPPLVFDADGFLGALPPDLAGRRAEPSFFLADLGDDTEEEEENFSYLASSSGLLRMDWTDLKGEENEDE